MASIMSAASVYSQESWKGNHSPFVPLLKPVDTRRHAIAFSPSVQWSDLSDAHDQEESVQEHELVEVPLSSAPLDGGVSHKEAKEEFRYAVPMPLPMDLIVPPTMVVSIPEAVQVDEKAGAKLKKKKKATEDASSRISKHSKAFGKVMGRISLQPSKKELLAVERRQTAMATLSHPMPKFNLSELKPIDSRKTVVDYRLPEVKTPGPIRMSFIVGSSQAPEIPTLPQALAPAFVLLPSISEPAIVENPSFSEKDAQGLERVRLFRATMMPGTPSWRQRSLTPPPPLSPTSTPAPIAAAPTRKGHRRYKSSPAVMNFDFHGWDEASMPPLPPMPVVIPAGMKLAPAPATPGPRAGTVRPQARARSQSVVVHPPGARRAVAPPFPPPRLRQASF